MSIAERIILWLEMYPGECEERDLLNDALEEIERLRLENNKLHTECGHLQADLSEQRAEISRLNDEISYYESLTGEECQDWPHRDGRYRDWLHSRLRERDEAREAARWCWSRIHAHIEACRAIEQWPWLKEVEE